MTDEPLRSSREEAFAASKAERDRTLEAMRRWRDSERLSEEPGPFVSAALYRTKVIRRVWRLRS